LKIVLIFASLNNLLFSSIFWNIFIGFSGRSRSQQSSRENSVTRPVIRETAQPPALSREVSKGTSIKESKFLEEYFVLTDLLYGV
jgi:hypothetical protein